jgi:hypothetical protein
MDVPSVKAPITGQSGPCHFSPLPVVLPLLQCPPQRPHLTPASGVLPGPPWLSRWSGPQQGIARWSVMWTGAAAGEGEER